MSGASSRERFSGWAWVGFGGVATVLLPVWILLTAVVIQLTPELAGLDVPLDADGNEIIVLDGDGEGPSGPGTLEVLVRGGGAAGLLLLAGAPLMLGVAAVAGLAGRYVRQSQDRLRASLDQEVASDAVLDEPGLEVQGAARTDTYGESYGEEDLARAALEEPPPATTGTPLADPGRRVAATLIDLASLQLGLLPLLVAAGAAILADEASPALPLTWAATAALGATLLLAIGVIQVLLLRRGQTIGKRLLRIRIVSVSGEPVDLYATFVLRVIGFGLLTLLLPGLGAVLALVIDLVLLFGEDRRTLHDLLAGTTVVDG